MLFGAVLRLLGVRETSYMEAAVKLIAKLRVYNTFKTGKDYSGAKLFYTEPISLNKAHSTK